MDGTPRPACARVRSLGVAPRAAGAYALGTATLAAEAVAGLGTGRAAPSSNSRATCTRPASGRRITAMIVTTAHPMM